MKVAVTGASGLIGSALVPALLEDGHDVVRLVRRDPGPGEVRWDPDSALLDPHDLEGVEAGIHLAGAGIGDKRWSPAYKALVVESRVHGTDLFARRLADVGARVLLSGSAVGYYGDTGDEPVTETATHGTGFLAETCAEWEAATHPAADAGLRVALLRTGLVLTRHGGYLGKQLGVFRLGLGARLGNGRQWQSWISRDDHVAATRFLLTSDIEGPVNLTSPGAVTQAAMAKAIGRAVHRPVLGIVPGSAVSILLGDFAREGVLVGQRVVPEVLEKAGFRFEHPEIDQGLKAALQD